MRLLILAISLIISATAFADYDCIKDSPEDFLASLQTLSKDELYARLNQCAMQSNTLKITMFNLEQSSCSEVKPCLNLYLFASFSQAVAHHRFQILYRTYLAK